MFIPHRRSGDAKSEAVVALPLLDAVAAVLARVDLNEICAGAAVQVLQTVGCRLRETVDLVLAGAQTHCGGAAHAQPHLVGARAEPEVGPVGHAMQPNVVVTGAEATGDRTSPQIKRIGAAAPDHGVG